MVSIVVVMVKTMMMMLLMLLLLLMVMDITVMMRKVITDISVNTIVTFSKYMVQYDRPAVLGKSLGFEDIRS